MDEGSPKTELMIIGHPLSTKKLELSETFELNGSEIKRVEKVKYLGLIIDEKLHWDEQFKRIGSKINTGLMSDFKAFFGKVGSAVFIMVLLKATCDMMLFGVA